MSRKGFDTTKGKNKGIHKTAMDISHAITAKTKPCKGAIDMYRHVPYALDIGRTEVTARQ